MGLPPDAPTSSKRLPTTDCRWLRSLAVEQAVSAANQIGLPGCVLPELGPEDVDEEGALGSLSLREGCSANWLLSAPCTWEDKGRVFHSGSYLVTGMPSKSGSTWIISHQSIEDTFLLN